MGLSEWVWFDRHVSPITLRMLGLLPLFGQAYKYIYIYMYVYAYVDIEI